MRTENYERPLNKCIDDFQVAHLKQGWENEENKAKYWTQGKAIS